MALSIFTLNANALRDQSKRAGLLQLLRSLIAVPDIVCLQECHCSSDLKCQAWFRFWFLVAALNLLSLLCFLVILTLFLTGLLAVADQIPLMYLASLFVL